MSHTVVQKGRICSPWKKRPVYCGAEINGGGHFLETTSVPQWAEVISYADCLSLQNKETLASSFYKVNCFYAFMKNISSGINCAIGASWWRQQYINLHSRTISFTKSNSPFASGNTTEYNFSTQDCSKKVIDRVKNMQVCYIGCTTNQELRWVICINWSSTLPAMSVVVGKPSLTQCHFSKELFLLN